MYLQTQDFLSLTLQPEFFYNLSSTLMVIEDCILTCFILTRRRARKGCPLLFVNFTGHIHPSPMVFCAGWMWQIRQNCLICHTYPRFHALQMGFLWLVNCRKLELCSISGDSWRFYLVNWNFSAKSLNCIFIFVSLVS